MEAACSSGLSIIQSSATLFNLPDTGQITQLNSLAEDTVTKSECKGEAHDQTGRKKRSKAKQEEMCTKSKWGNILEEEKKTIQSL
jgi:hypothetical protein